MSNEIKVSLSEEQLSKLVEQVVLKKLEEYLNKTYVIENSVRLVVSEYLNANDIASKIKDIISNLAGSEDTVLSRVLDRHVEAWIKNNSNVNTIGFIPFGSGTKRKVSENGENKEYWNKLKLEYESECADSK